MRIETRGFELEAHKRSIYFAGRSLTVYLSRAPRRNAPLSWDWSRDDSPPGTHSWHPTRTRSLEAAWRTLELTLNWTRPVPGSVGLDPNEPADGDYARAEREEREELAKYEAEWAEHCAKARARIEKE